MHPRAAGPPEHHQELDALASEKSRQKQIYVVTEFIDGQSLRTMLRNERVERALDVTRQLCSALVYLHGQNIAHRDHATTELACGCPTDFVGRKRDAVVNEQEGNLDEEKSCAKLTSPNRRCVS